MPSKVPGTITESLNTHTRHPALRKWALMTLMVALSNLFSKKWKYEKRGKVTVQCITQRTLPCSGDWVIIITDKPCL